MSRLAKSQRIDLLRFELESIEAGGREEADKPVDKAEAGDAGD